MNKCKLCGKELQDKQLKYCGNKSDKKSCAHKAWRGSIQDWRQKDKKNRPRERVYMDWLNAQ